MAYLYIKKSTLRLSCTKILHLKDDVSPNKGLSRQNLVERLTQATQSIQTEENYEPPQVNTTSEAVQVFIDHNEPFNSLRVVEKSQRASMRAVLNGPSIQKYTEKSEKHKHLENKDVKFNTAIQKADDSDNDQFIAKKK